MDFNLLILILIRLTFLFTLYPGLSVYSSIIKFIIATLIQHLRLLLTESESSKPV